MPPMAAELLERGPILDRLAHEFAAAASEGRAVFVAGEAGAGKSTVVDAFGATLRPPVRLVRGDCDALETPAPLAPIGDLAWTLGGELEQLIERSAPVHEIAGAVLDGLSPRRVIVIEDLHWADAATLDVVRLVCRRLPRATGLLIVTYRDDQIGRVDPLRVLLGEVSSMTGVSRLHLDPLSQNAVARLADGTGLDAAALHQQTHGNAFFVTEVLAAGGQSIPATVSDAVLARAARLERERPPIARRPGGAQRSCRRFTPRDDGRRRGRQHRGVLCQRPARRLAPRPLVDHVPSRAGPASARGGLARAKRGRASTPAPCRRCRRTG